MSFVAGFLGQKEFSLQGEYGMNLPFFFELLIKIAQHDSLMVSIPILHVWTKLLMIRPEKIGGTDLITSFIPPLLALCSERLTRWDSLPEDTENPTVMFLNEDIDTIPEKHAFVGNYRKYCSSIIDTIVQERPEEAIPYVLSGVDAQLNNLYSGVPQFSGMLTLSSSFC